VTVAPRCLGLALCAAALAGCVAPAPDTSAYESKAGTAASAAVSAARTALTAEHTYLADRLPSSYLEQLLVESEDALGSVQTSFDSVQPPATSGADALRQALDPLLEKAGSSLTDLRIAARRDRPADLRSAAGDLSAVADKLDAFAQEHGG
jgi:hypothetical protein